MEVFKSLKGVEQIDIFYRDNREERVELLLSKPIEEDTECL